MIKIGLIGYGYWGPNVAKNIYKNKEFVFSTICDKKPERLDMAQDVYVNAINYELNYQSVLNDPSIDAIALAVETSSHYLLVKEALLAGKHVYVEKPFTENVNQAVELEKLAKDKGLIIHVDHIMVYHPIIRKIKKTIQEDVLGDILYYSCSRMNLGNIKNDVNSMWDLSIHDLSIIDYLSNGETPDVINAMGSKAYSTKEAITFLNIQYKTFLATITASWISPIKERRIIIAGTKKMLVYDDVDIVNKLIIYDKGFDIKSMEYDDFVVKARNGDAIIPKLPQGDALYDSIEQFRKCICEHKASISDASSAIRLLKILEKADSMLNEGGSYVGQ